MVLHIMGLILNSQLSLIRGTIWNGYSAYCDRVLKCTVLYKSVSTVRVHSVDTTTHDSDTMFITVTTLSPVQALVRCPLRAVRLLWAIILFSHIRRSYDPLYLLYKKTKYALLYSWASTLTRVQFAEINKAHTKIYIYHYSLSLSIISQYQCRSRLWNYDCSIAKRIRYFSQFGSERYMQNRIHTYKYIH